ncbi:glycosyltransferase family 39 protein [Nevskia ramosa]|uniref:glycosyltransferase family 39 protein n=1 Tax=Nevskia ramosa TaxID=64002 RepID=UPI0004075C53|nr:glycosyltransferase family 39 protein [Nevskia ramosa]
MASVFAPDLPKLDAWRFKLGLWLLFLLVVIRFAWMSDDAYISLRTVWNFTHGYGLTWNPVERVQAYTHPLWLFLLAGVHAISGEMYLTVLVVSILCSALAVAFVLWRLATRLPQAIAFVALLLCSQAVLDYTTSGLENPLSFLLAATFCWLWLAPAEQPKPLFRLFLVGCLLTLNRLDLVLLVLPALAWLLWRRRSWRSLGLASLALLPLLAWEVFSLIYYGVPFPNTYYAKLSTGIPAVEYRLQGLLYLVDLATHDPGTLLLVLLGIGAAFGSGARRPMAFGLLLYLVYVVSAGGDFMQGRFLSVPAFIAAILLTAGRDDGTQPFGDKAMLGSVALIVVLAASRLIDIEGPDPLIRASGIANERQYYAGSTALATHSRDRPVPYNHPWGELGKSMRQRPPERIFEAGVIGFMGYAAGPTVQLVDHHALSDAFLARLPCLRPWRIGHFKRAFPDGYLASLRSGENRITDPALRPLYDDVRLVTRGELFSAERWAAIGRLNLYRVADAAPASP